MFATTLNRLAFSLPAIFGASTSRKTRQPGPLPKWIDDPQLSKQLLNDTGLSADDLGGRKVSNEHVPSITPQNYW